MTLVVATSELENLRTIAIAQSTLVKCQETAYEVLHATRGRIRIGIPRLACDREYGDRLIYVLKSLAFVTNVRINPIAECVAIEYQEGSALETQIQQSILAAIQEADRVVFLPNDVLEELEEDIASLWEWFSNGFKNAVGVASLVIGVVLLPIPIVPGWPFLLLGVYCLNVCEQEKT
jgi:hypothetical protein